MSGDGDERGLYSANYYRSIWFQVFRRSTVIQVFHRGRIRACFFFVFFFNRAENKNVIGMNKKSVSRLLLISIIFIFLTIQKKERQRIK